jgi:hypothetical protein
VEGRLSHALVLNKDIDEAARVLGDAAGHAHLSPRLTQELHTTPSRDTETRNPHPHNECDRGRACS